MSDPITQPPDEPPHYKLAAQAMRDNSLFQTIIDTLTDSVYVKDTQGRYIFNNLAHMARRGVKTHEDIVGKTVFDLFPNEIAQRFQVDDQTIIATGQPLLDREEPYTTYTGEQRWFSTTKVPFRDESGAIIGVIGISRDITEKKRTQEELATDALTGLLNRKTILKYAAGEWQRWHRYKDPLSVLILDADNFKQINDTYGHAAGDQALTALARALSDSLRDVDCLGRYGGEEFLVFLSHTSLNGAMIVAEKIMENVRALVVPLPGIRLGLTASIGVAEATHGDKDLSALIERADRALLSAKRNGKDQIQIDPE